MSDEKRVDGEQLQAAMARAAASRDFKLPLERVEQVQHAQKLVAMYFLTKVFAASNPHGAMLTDSWSLDITERDLLAVDSFSLRFERHSYGGVPALRITVARPGAERAPGSSLANAIDEDTDRDGPRG